MYSVKLTKSYFQSQSDIHIMDVSIGDVLKETAIHRTGMEALVEITRDGEEGRRWSLYNSTGRHSEMRLTQNKIFLIQLSALSVEWQTSSIQSVALASRQELT